MGKIISIALILNIIGINTSAEPAFRFDERKSPGAAATKSEPAPARPAYYDAYKKDMKKNAAPAPSQQQQPQTTDQSSQSSNAPAKPLSEMPANAMTPEVKQAIQDQLKNVDPAVLQKAQEQMNSYQPKAP